MLKLTRRLVLLVCISMLASLIIYAQSPAVSIGGNDDLGNFLVASGDSMTLYTFGNDPAGTSTCEGGCLENWPAYTVSSADEAIADAGVEGTIGVITRSDGSLQVTHNDKPLYFFIGDNAPGDATGNGAGGVWYIVSVDSVETEESAPVEEVTESNAEPAAVVAELPENNVITIHESSLGNVLADVNGMTLYTFANDQDGVSNCIDRCLELWPALTIESADALPAGDGLFANLGVIERNDGTLQVTLGGSPLYTYAEDLAPGDVNGQGVGSVWFAVTLDLVRAGDSPALGSILVAANNGMTLYTFANDEEGISNCIDRCAEIWPPFLVDANTPIFASATGGTLSIIERGDGSQQLALDGQPLYFYSEDVAPGDTNGQGVGSVWFAVSLDTIRVANIVEFGSVLTDANGMTLYVFANDEPGWSNCVGDCANVWPPMTVTSADAVFAPDSIAGTLATSARADGSFHVTYNDQPVYYFTGDQAPGETNGQGLGDGAWSVAIVNEVAANSTSCIITPALNQINLRSGPGTNFEQTGNANINTPLVTDGQTVGADGFIWYHLADNSWARSDVVNVPETCANLPDITI